MAPTFNPEELEGLPEIPPGYVWIFVAVPEEVAAEITTATEFSIGTVADPQPGAEDDPERRDPDGNCEAEEPESPDR